MTPEQKQAYDQATEQVKSLFSSFEAAQFNKRLIELYKIPETTIVAFLEVTGNVVLGISQISSLPEELKKMGIAEGDAAKITNAFLNYLEPDTATKDAPDIDMKTYMQEEETGGASAEAVDTSVSPVSNLRAGGGIRTMNQDMNTLKDAPPAATTPEVTKPPSNPDVIPAPPETKPAEPQDEPVVKSLSQAELQGRHAAVPDYTKSE